MNYRIVERFVSINGEGKKSGQLSVFIRFKGCNLNCSYCDTLWANKENVEYENMTEMEIYRFIKETGVNNITLTGGEPLIQDNILGLVKYLLLDQKLQLEIETNGSIDISPFVNLNRLTLTMDYKLPSSRVESKMDISNLKKIRKEDVIKFVVSCESDLDTMKNIIKEFDLVNRTNVYVSPTFEEIDPRDIVEFMKYNKLNNTTLNIQLHKIIWDKERRGV
ncbi:putative 7-carboxy-7-deazaguanine synthase QueE [Dethiothermospora halolimnae]|uniref:putative 7-carboxy-7-deazaguanine synthase QueE n=1 Tax=Dethiothermospora halolimnae TaxID=3114390 RepID=UPI003CCBA8AC